MKYDSIFKSNVHFKVNSSNNSIFWLDKWIFEIPLQLKYPNFYALLKSKNMNISDMFVEEENNWNFAVPRRLNASARNELFDLQRSLLSISINKDNEIIWSITSKGQFTIKSTYDSLTDGNLDQSQQYLFKYIWEQKGPPKIAFFLWTIYSS